MYFYGVSTLAGLKGGYVFLWCKYIGRTQRWVIMYFFGVSTLAGLKGGLLCISMV